MSGIPHDHYEPKTGAEKWLHSRLPIVSLMYDTLMIPTPKNLNWMWIWGIVLTFCLVLQIVTGIILVMHYTPHVDLAFASIEHIMRNVNGGHFIRYLHMNGASLFFFAVYIHIFRGLYYGSYKAPREITWIIGMLIYLMMMGTAFMGYVLPWGQMSFWGATVITGLFGAIPFIGEGIQTWLLGGPAVDNATLNRFFSLHYLLPFVIAALVAVHIWAFHTTGNNNPTGVDVRRGSKAEAEKDTLPFWPYFVIKDLFALAVIMVVFFAIVGFMPNYLGHPDNYIEANALATPAHIVPEWYFLPFYAILRAFTSRCLGRATGQLDHRRHHRRQVLRRSGDVWRDRGHGSGAVAGHIQRPFGPVSPDVQVVVCPAGHRLHRADVAGCASGGRALRDLLADRLGLLVRLFPGDPAAARCHREANCRSLKPSKMISTRITAKPKHRLNKKGIGIMMKKISIAAVTALTLSAGGAMAAGAEGHVHDVDFSFEGPFGKFDQNQLQRGLAGLYRGLLGLPRAALRAAADIGGRRWPAPARRSDARLCRTEFRGFRPRTGRHAPCEAHRSLPGIEPGECA